MIGFFQMNQTGGLSGLQVSGNTTIGAEAGDNLFSILLNNMNGSLEDNNKSLGPSLSAGAIPINTTISKDNPGSGINLLDNNSVKPNQGSTKSYDLLLPESDIPNLISFLEQEGFTTEQIDRMILSSRNDDGLIQIHKLVTSINSAKAGVLSDEAGPVVGQPFIPKVQELLFNMGLGVGEVRDIVEKSSDDNGGVSIDKLTGALNEQLPEPIPITELVLLLEQNDISVTPQIADNSPAVSDPNNNDGLNLRSSDTAANISVTGKDIPHNPGISSVSDAEFDLKNGNALNHQSSDAAAGISVTGKEIPHNTGTSNVSGTDLGLKGDINVVKDISVSASDALDLKNNTITASEGNDINKAVIEFKKEFMDFVNGKSGSPDETQKQETVVQSGEKTAQMQEFKAINGRSAPDNTFSGQAKAGTQGSNQEGGALNQESSKDQSQWQKDNDIRGAHILNNKKSLNSEVAEGARSQEKAPTMKDAAEFLKQGDQKVKPEALTDISENKTLSKIQSSEGTDIKDGLLNMKETYTVDPISQNTAKVSGNAEINGYNKTSYNLPEPLPKVFDQMVVMIKNGEQTGRLMIRPPELGKIDIDLTVKNGHIQANLSTDNFVVKEIIEANLGQLRQQLSDQGFIVEQFNVSVGSQNRQSQDNSHMAWSTGEGQSDQEVAEIDDISTDMNEGIGSNLMGSPYRIDMHV